MDHPLLLALNGLLREPGAGLWAWLGTRPATGVYVAFSLIWLWSSPARRRWLPAVLLAVVLADTSTNHLWKPTFERARPCAEQPALLTAPPGEPRRCGQDFSFPSGHSASSAAIAAASLSPPLVALSLLSGTQRVVTAQHWPTDVLGGWTWGAFVGLSVRWALARRLRREKPSAEVPAAGPHR